jgi:hypothetical protein
MSTNNPALADFDALMNASMDDIDDLPPIGVPPTGSYDLEVTATREKSDKGSEYIKFSYLIKNVNEVKNPDEAGECAADQKFMEMFSPFKKDGTINEIGMGMLKERVAVFSAFFETPKIGDTLEQIKSVAIVATLTRRADKREEGRFNFMLKDVTIV